MKASDIVLLLAKNLPKYSSLFTNNINITSLTRSGTTVTGTTSDPHGLSVGAGINITGASAPIGVSSLTRLGPLGTAITDADHDFTLGLATPTIDIIGANESEFNGSFIIVGVPNRRTVTFQIDDSGATTATGTTLSTNGSSALKQYNGLYGITSIPSASTFTYEVNNSDMMSPAVGDSIQGRVSARISAVVNVDRLIDAYTKNPANELWLFVSLGTVSASKNRNILSDAVDNTQRQQYFKQQILQNVTLYLVIPTAVEQIVGRQARDLSEDLFRPICQSILFHKFPTGLYCDANNPLQFVSHDFTAYNTAYYIHEYNFQQVADLLFEDTVGYSEDVAFRDIALDLGPDIGTGSLIAEINLDEDLA